MGKEYHTRYRDWLLGYFKDNADTLFRAKDLHTQMTTEGYSINLATVYRNLDKLCADGVIAMRKTKEEETFYQYLQPQIGCSQHLHLLCSGCGRIFHLNCGFMDEIQTHLLSDHGFYLNCEASMLTGLCSECLTKENSPKIAAAIDGHIHAAGAPRPGSATQTHIQE